MRKRKRQEVRQPRCKRHRRIILSSSSSSSSLWSRSPSRSTIRNSQEDSDLEVIEEPHDMISLTSTYDPLAPGDVPPTNTKGVDNIPSETTDVPLRTTDQPPENIDDPPKTNDAPPATTQVATGPGLDPALLEALGDVPDDTTNEYGANIHQQLASRWLPILKKGMPKDAKQQLLKEHTIPGNCQLLKAPNLNAEIAGVVSQKMRGRDKKIQARQDQLGLGISAINRAIDLLLTGERDERKIRAVKYLSDACRILSDLHFVQTQLRKKLITPGLDKNFVSIIEHQDRDETLFGDELSAKIIAFKASQQIRRDNVPNASSPSPLRSRSRRHRSVSLRSSTNRRHSVSQEFACGASVPPAAGPALGDLAGGDVGSQQQTQDPVLPLVTQI